jgi:hypothetical protein
LFEAQQPLGRDLGWQAPVPPLDFQGGQRRTLNGLLDLSEIVQVQTAA